MYNEVQPSILAPPGRIIVIGDVHGDVQRFMHCLYACNIINQNLEWIAEPKNTFVVQLGDQVDSLNRGGTPGWEKVPDIEMIYMSDKLDTIARMHGGRVLSMLGNHEIINSMGDFTFVSPDSLQKVSPDVRKKMFEPGGSIAHILSKRNVVLKIGSHLFCHGGIIPMHFEHVKQFHRINQITSKFFRRAPLTSDEFVLFRDLVVSESGILWTRLYMDLAMHEESKLVTVLKELHSIMDTKRIYVGHNTVPAISMVAEGMIVFVDAGLSRAYPFDGMQVLDIMAPDTPNEEIRIVKMKK